MNFDNDYLDEEDEGGYQIEKSLIMEAWAKYRPPSIQQSPDGSIIKQKRKKDLSELFGHNFIQKLLHGIKHKVYRGKRDFLSQEQQLLNNKSKLEKMLWQYNRLDQENDDMNFMKIPKEEIHLIDHFLEKFIFV